MASEHTPVSVSPGLVCINLGSLIMSLIKYLEDEVEVINGTAVERVRRYQVLEAAHL